jgi:hypothetical protein
LIRTGWCIVIKPDPGVDPVKEPGLGFYGSTRVNSGQPGSTRKILKKYIFKVLIFHKKNIKIRKRFS